MSQQHMNLIATDFQLALQTQRSKMPKSKFSHFKVRAIRVYRRYFRPYTCGTRQIADPDDQAAPDKAKMHHFFEVFDIQQK
jgi:hypothetical protein